MQMLDEEFRVRRGRQPPMSNPLTRQESTSHQAPPRRGPPPSPVDGQAKVCEHCSQAYPSEYQ